MTHKLNWDQKRSTTENPNSINNRNNFTFNIHVNISSNILSILLCSASKIKIKSYDSTWPEQITLLIFATYLRQVRGGKGRGEWLEYWLGKIVLGSRIGNKVFECYWNIINNTITFVVNKILIHKLIYILFCYWS